MGSQSRRMSLGKPRWAYVIHAYKHSEQLGRLTRSLATPEVAFYIHIDARVDIRPFQAALTRAGAGNLVFVKREKSRWSSMGCVKAVLNAMAEIEKSESIEYTYLLSGQDYPIKSNSYIAAFFEENKDTTYMSAWPLPTSCWSGDGGLDRLRRYHVQSFNSRALREGLDRVLGLLHPLIPERRLPDELEPYGGSFYFGLSRHALRYILDFVRARPEYLKFHRFALTPEETFFQTILMNATDPLIRDRFVARCLTYQDWPAVGPAPAILTENHLPALEKSDCLFGRKFDMEISPAVLDALDVRNGLPGQG
jgi:hypothetical protein